MTKLVDNLGLKYIVKNLCQIHYYFGQSALEKSGQTHMQREGEERERERMIGRQRHKERHKERKT